MAEQKITAGNNVLSNLEFDAVMSHVLLIREIAVRYDVKMLDPVLEYLSGVATIAQKGNKQFMSNDDIKRAGANINAAQKKLFRESMSDEDFEHIARAFRALKYIFPWKYGGKV